MTFARRWIRTRRVKVPLQVKLRRALPVIGCSLALRTRRRHAHKRGVRTSVLMQRAHSGCETLFYAHIDRSKMQLQRNDMYCESFSPFCHPQWSRRLLAHACRTRQLALASSVVIVNPIFPMLPSCSGGNTSGYDLSEALLAELPAAVKSHPHPVLLAVGEMVLYKPYLHHSITDRALWLSHEPLFERVQRDYVSKSDLTNADSVSQAYQRKDFCHRPVPAINVVAVPFVGAVSHGWHALAREPRQYRVSFFGGNHGMGYAKQLRRRLHALCRTQASWQCWEADRGLGYLLNVTRSSDFCLCPAGEFPARAMIWHALRSGCVPVLFSSCPSAIVDGYDEIFLPQEHAKARYGARSWSVVLDLAAVMSNDSYVASSLDAIPAHKLHSMRRLLSHHSDDISYDLPSEDRTQNGTVLPRVTGSARASHVTWRRDAVERIVEIIISRPKRDNSLRPAFADPSTQVGAPLAVCE